MHAIRMQHCSQADLHGLHQGVRRFFSLHAESQVESGFAEQVACVWCRLILTKREAKAVTEADMEALDWWFDLEDDFELLSFKAWNAVIYQVCTAALSIVGPQQMVMLAVLLLP